MRTCLVALAVLRIAALGWVGTGICESRVEAQRFSVDWDEIGTSAGTSSAGQFTVSGSIEPVDSGTTLQGGSYTLTSGYWSLITALQMPGAPRLVVSMKNPSTVTISWPVSPAGFLLQQSAAMNPANWVNVREVVTVSEGFNRIDVNVSKASTFYRLVRP